MPHISDELYNEICAANDIVDYASAFMTLKRNGRSYMACCPFHNEKTPSFNIDRDKQLFHCFGCGASGNFVQLVMRLEGLDFNDAIRQLAERGGIQIPENGQRAPGAAEKRKDAIYAMNKIAARFFYDSLTDPTLGREARSYFAGRRLSKQTIIKFGLGYAPAEGGTLLARLKADGYGEEQIIDAGLAVKRDYGIRDKFRNRVMFPIINARGKVIGFGGRVLGSAALSDGRKLAKYLNSPATPVFDKGSNLFALNFAKKSNRKNLILCEGYMDVITVHQAGISNCVATLGTAITEEQARLMLRYGEEILICYDMDEAGTTAALRAIDIITAVGGRSRVVRISGAKDPDEYISKYGVAGFKKALDTAVPSTEFRISLVRKKYDITDPDGKIGFVEEAAKILTNLPDPVEAEAYIKEISDDTGISAQAIMGKCAEIRSKANRYRKPPRTKEEYKRRELSEINRDKPAEERVTGAVVEAEKRLISVISGSRRMCLKAAALIEPEEFSNSVYVSLVEKIYQCAKSGKSADLEVATMLNEFSGDRTSENTAAAAFFNREEYSDDLIAVYDLIYKIKKNKLDARMKAATDATEIRNILDDENELKRRRLEWERGN